MARWCVGADGERFAKEEEANVEQKYSDPMVQRAYEAGFKEGVAWVQEGIEVACAALGYEPDPADQQWLDAHVPHATPQGTGHDDLDDLRASEESSGDPREAEHWEQWRSELGDSIRKMVEEA